MEQNLSPNRQSDEIDLRELACTLWKSKLQIIVTTLLITCIAAAYAFLSTPIYEATVRTLPPTAADLTSYNMGSQLTSNSIIGKIAPQSANAGSTSSGLKALTVKEAYDAFLQRLNSDTVRQAFFNEVYLPAHDGALTESSKQTLWKQLNKELKIKVPAKAGESTAEVSWEGDNPATIAKWANNYVELALDATRHDLLDDLASEVALRKQGTAKQIDILRKTAPVERSGRITRIESALAVAKEIGLEEPVSNSTLISIGGSTSKNEDDNILYLRGSKALQSELNQLKSRVKDDAFIADLPDLLKNQALLNSVSLAPERFSVARIDRAAVPPEAPIKPKRALILALGIILGGVLSIFIALIRKYFNQN